MVGIAAVIVSTAHAALVVVARTYKDRQLRDAGERHVSELRYLRETLQQVINTSTNDTRRHTLEMQEVLEELVNRVTALESGQRTILQRTIRT